MDDLKALTAKVSEERRLEECPICLERLPAMWERSIKGLAYYCQVCGKEKCKKCIDEHVGRNPTNTRLRCVICRNPTPGTKEESFELTLSTAKEGRAFARYSVGACYRRGDGVAADPSKALPWLEKASNQGWFEASVDLGQMYAEGEGVEKNLVKAREYFELAAVSNDADALRSLAVCLANSPRDLEERINLLRRCANDGLHSSQRDLAWAYYHGTGVPKSVPEALRWSLQAAEQGCPESQYLASRVMIEINGHEVMPKALYWLRKAAAQGDHGSKEALGEYESILSERCARCQKTKRSSAKKMRSRCSRCAAIYYCSQNCQILDWRDGHKRECIPKDIEKRSLEERIAFFMS